MSRKVVNRTIAFEEWVCDDVPSPLGRINIGGLVTHRGIPAHAMRVLGDFALIYLLEGGGHFIDAHRHRAEVRPGTLLLLFPGVAHAYGPPPGGLWRELFLHFEGPLFELLQTRGVLDERRPIHHALPVDKWQERLLELAHTPRLAREVDTTAKIFRLANLLSQITSDEPSLPPPEEWFQHACRLLKGNISEPFNLNLVAQSGRYVVSLVPQKVPRALGCATGSLSDAGAHRRRAAHDGARRIDRSRRRHRVGFRR